MNQFELDFNKDVNERIYTAEENYKIDAIVADYNARRLDAREEIIITQLFFEEHCIEIVKRLKSDKYFEGEWKLKENHLSSIFLEFINNKKTLIESSLTEFILILINLLDANIKPIDWQNNEKNKFEFDRKITEGIITNICEGNIEKAAFPFVGYVKIWNYYNIYKNPFNNNKALLIHRIFADKLWPKFEISYDMYRRFEELTKSIIIDINKKGFYVPFFDDEQNSYYTANYLLEREKFKRNIENLFDYDNTDETEPYYSLIEDFLTLQSDSKLHVKNLICKKVDKLMYPSFKDVEMIIKLYESPIEKEFGKWLLSKFYLFNCLNYDN